MRNTEGINEACYRSRGRIRLYKDGSWRRARAELAKIAEEWKEREENEKVQTKSKAEALSKGSCRFMDRFTTGRHDD